MDLASVNYLAVIVSALVAFVLGALWYSPVLFSKIWQKEVGLTDADIKDTNMLQIFGSSLVMMLLMSFGLALLFQLADPLQLDMIWGLQTGLMVGLLFSATSIGINYLYQRKSLKLWLIDASYQVLFIAIAGAIIASWR